MKQSQNSREIKASINPKDNEAGTISSLEKLAKYIEGSFHKSYDTTSSSSASPQTPGYRPVIIDINLERVVLTFNNIPQKRHEEPVLSATPTSWLLTDCTDFH